MRVMVTGGAGFLGGHICEELIRQVSDLEVLHVIDDLSSGSMENLIDATMLCEEYDIDWCFFGGDVADPWPPGCSGYDLIIHAASPASPIDHMRDAWATISANLLGARNAVGALRSDGLGRILFLSTSEVYGDPECSPQGEDYHGRVNINGPRAPYDEGKRVTEAYLSNLDPETGVEVRIARIFNTYGPRMRPSDGRVVSSFITQALAGEDLTVHGDGSQTRSFCWYEDTVRGLVQLALATNPDLDRTPVNIGNPDEISVLELAEEVRRIVPGAGQIRHTSVMPDDPTNRRPDISRAWDMLKWRPQVTWRVGVYSMVEWFSSQNKKEA